MADFNSLNYHEEYLGSILPVASVSKRLKASRNSSISSAVRPGRYTFFFAGPLPPYPAFPLIAFNIIKKSYWFNKTFKFLIIQLGSEVRLSKILY